VIERKGEDKSLRVDGKLRRKKKDRAKGGAAERRHLTGMGRPEQLEKRHLRGKKGGGLKRDNKFKRKKGQR